MDYLVLTQRAQRPGGELRYLDVEGSLYHYPAAYFSKINGFEPFVYYRPQRDAPASERSSYVGYGRLLEWFPDVAHPDHRYVRVADYKAFAIPVPFAEADGRFYESEYASRNSFQGRSVRTIGAPDFMRIVSAAGVRGEPLAALQSVDALTAFDPLMLDRLPRTPPRQPFLAIDRIPDGAGYVPSGKLVDLRESAALQERARADHQGLLQSLLRMGESGGANAFYNNNVDLLLSRSNERILIEAKSLNHDRDAVDRMRYGMGQLFDYGVRYRAEVAGATPLLAFGRIPERDTGWIAEILEQNGVGFAALRRDDVLPLNETARATFLFR